MEAALLVELFRGAPLPDAPALDVDRAVFAEDLAPLAAVRGAFPPLRVLEDVDRGDLAMRSPLVRPRKSYGCSWAPAGRGTDEKCQ